MARHSAAMVSDSKKFVSVERAPSRGVDIERLTAQ
jgi:hypothetical protein